MQVRARPVRARCRLGSGCHEARRQPVRRCVVELTPSLYTASAIHFPWPQVLCTSRRTSKCLTARCRGSSPTRTTASGAWAACPRKEVAQVVARHDPNDSNTRPNTPTPTPCPGCSTLGNVLQARAAACAMTRNTTSSPSTTPSFLYPVASVVSLLVTYLVSSLVTYLVS